MIRSLLTVSGVSVAEQFPAERLTTFGLGADVPILVDIHETSSLSRVVEIISEAGKEFRIIGNGSNLVLPDSPLSCVVLRLGREFRETFSVGTLPPKFRDTIDDLGDDEFFVMAGAALMSLSRKMSLEGRTGLEFAAGIPASLGGAVRMNAGAHGSSISEVIKGVLIQRGGEWVWINPEPSDEIPQTPPSSSALHFSYRTSSILPSEIVLGAILKLPLGDPEQIQRKRQECLDYRKKTQPLHLPSAGSVFRNPGEPAARYLEQVKVKGERRGSLMYSELHSNWIVRVGDEGSAADFLELVELGKKRVFEQFGVKLEREVLVWE